MSPDESKQLRILLGKYIEQETLLLEQMKKVNIPPAQQLLQDRVDTATHLLELETRGITQEV